VLASPSLSAAFPAAVRRSVARAHAPLPATDRGAFLGIGADGCFARSGVGHQPRSFGLKDGQSIPSADRGDLPLTRPPPLFSAR